jgi:hypothetical protein
MAAIIQAILDAITPIWSWTTTTFVPATAADVTLIHVALWSSFIMSLVYGFLSLVMRRGKR